MPLPDQMGDLALARNPYLQIAFSRAHRAHIYQTTLRGIQAVNE